MIAHLSIIYQHPQGICHVRNRVVLHQNFLAYTKVDRTSRIIKLIVSHRSYQLRHTSQQSLAGRANPTVMNKHTQAREQLTIRCVGCVEKALGQR